MNETNHLVLQSVKATDSEIIGYSGQIPDTVDWSEDYQIIQCQGCDRISFRIDGWFSEYQDFDSDGTYMKIYPKRSPQKLTVKDFWEVPTILRRIYRETIECFNFESYTLCAAGLRALVEGICSEQQITDGPVESKDSSGKTTIKRKKNLQGKIAGLHEKGALTKGNSDILHEHRYLGNEAVHQLSQPSKDELKLAIEIIEHILESIYEIPEKAAEFQSKRLKRNS